MQYTITIDTEEEWDWSSEFRTDSNAVSNITALPEFQAACDRLGVKATYFTNHSVLRDRQASKIIRDLHENPNAEIGLHIHPWNTPPLGDNQIVPTRDSFLHNLSQKVALEKLDTVFKIFEQNKISPSSFRGGRYSTSNWIQDHLHRNGCVADASFLPFTTWSDEGAPDHRERDLLPRRRNMGPNAPGIWEIPLTLAFTRQPWRFWHNFYQLAEKSLLKQLRCIAIAERTFVKRVWLNLEHPMGEAIEKLLPVLRTADLPCINFTMHSSSLVAGLNPYTRTHADLLRIYDRLESAVSLLQSWPETSPATVTEVAQKLESQYHENSGN